MSSKLLKVLLGFFVLAIVLVIAMQVYIAMSNPYSVEVVYKGSVDESFDIRGVVTREETVLDAQKTGAVSYEIKNGDKVAKNAVVAQMYASEQDIANMTLVERLEAELAVVKESQTPGATAGTQASALSRQINSINREYVTALTNHNLSQLYDIKNSYLGTYNRSQVAFAGVTDFNARIDALQNEIASLQQQSGQSVSSVASPVSGYFVNAVDGFESALNLETALQLTEEQLEEYLNGQKAEPNNVLVGKVITSTKWRFTAIVDNSNANLLVKGRSYNLVFNSAGDQTVSAQVIENSYEATKEKAIVVFETDILSANLVKMRFEEAKVVLKVHEGIKVPKAALHIVKMEKEPEEGEESSSGEVEYEDVKGVYIRYGHEVQFKRVDIVYENEEFFISASKETELDRSKYLRIYDDVIVKGSDLYDGKQLN